MASKIQEKKINFNGKMEGVYLYPLRKGFRRKTDRITRKEAPTSNCRPISLSIRFLLAKIAKDKFSDQPPG